MTDPAPGGDADRSPDRPPRHVVALVSTRGISGPGRQLAALARALGEVGVELRIVLLVRPGVGLAGFDRFLDEQGVAYGLVDDRGPLDASLVRSLGRLFDERRPDIVQTHGYKTAGMAFALRRLGQRIPWIGFYHGDTDLGLKDRLYNRLHATLLRSADRIVLMSEGQRGAFERCRDKTVVIHNAVLPMPVLERAEPNLDRLRDFRDRSTGRLILVVGRMSHEKGFDVFLDALAAVRGEAPPCAALVGDGPLRGELEQQAERLGLGERVLFAGTIESMHAVYPVADLLVIPSRSEGLPNVLLEAVGAGVPVVSTPVGAVPEVLAAAPQAFVMVERSDPAAITEGIHVALDELAHSPAARDEARATLANALSPEQRVARHLDLYAGVLAAGEHP